MAKIPVGEQMIIPPSWKNELYPSHGTTNILWWRVWGYTKRAPFHQRVCVGVWGFFF